MGAVLAREDCDEILGWYTIRLLVCWTPRGRKPYNCWGRLLNKRPHALVHLLDSPAPNSACQLPTPLNTGIHPGCLWNLKHRLYLNDSFEFPPVCGCAQAHVGSLQPSSHTSTGLLWLCVCFRFDGGRRDDVKSSRFVAGFKNSFKILCIFILKKCNTAWKPLLLNINHIEPLIYV